MPSDPIQVRLEKAFATPVANELCVPAEGVVAVVLAYNEALRFPYFLQHYRQIGVRHFIVVDNNSNDGTGKFLAGQADVSVIRTEKLYSEHKSTWRQLICERYLQNRWVIFPDVDELFIYPGWPELGIDELVRHLDESSFRALFCPMVDMYPQGPLKDISYEAGESFFDTCPYFDATGYRYNPLKGSHRKRYKTPARHIFGGTRERLFHQHAKRQKNRVDKVLLSTSFSVFTSAPSSKVGRIIDHLLFKIVKDALPTTAAVQSKIPLIKWDASYKFSGGVHGIEKEIPLAHDWGALLHFKYLDDFESKVNEAIERRQHTDNAGHYVDYSAQMVTVLERGLKYSGSKKFSGVQSLLDCGLMRVT